MRAAHLIGVVLAMLPVAASATETIAYTYDAKGRLTKVQHSGSANNGVSATYAFDAADNRTNVTVAGAASSGPAQAVAVLTIGGLKVVPLPSTIN